MPKRAFVGFAGFGGVDIALREDGYYTIGIEIDNDIAGVNRSNGGNCQTGDILQVHAADYIGYDLMHFSPPCPNFSRAKASSSEGELDIALAKKIGQFVEVGHPDIFTLENVWAYRKSESWGMILGALRKMGYGVDWWHLNAADYGVPQTRKRMIVIAWRDGRKPSKPWPTHRKKPDMFTLPWRGWYEAIEDLIPTLPDSKFAPWQSDRLIASGIINKAVLIGGSNKSKSFLEFAKKNRPNIPNVNVSSSPSMAIVERLSPSDYRAFIVDSQNASNDPITNRSEDQPMFTVVANAFEKGAPPKAIVGGHYQSPSNVKPRIPQNRLDDSPIWTIVASENGDTRASIGGRVVSITPRCLARFQDFPDWFELPANRKLASRGIGNAVPPGLYRAVLKSLL